MSDRNGRVEPVNGTPNNLPPSGDRHAVCGFVWLTLGSVICALSVVGLGERPLREVVVYGVQGLLIALYGCYRLWLAHPVRLRAASSPARRDARRSRRPAVTAAHRSPVGGASAAAL